MKTMVTRVQGGTIISLHNALPPTREDWSEYMEALRDLIARHGGKTESLSRLVLTDGGSPNPAQRGEVNRFLDGRQLRVAIITDSTMVRSVVTALSWFNSLIKAFSPEALNAAFEHLKVSMLDQSIIRKTLYHMQPELGEVQVLRAIEEQSQRAW
jgi:hypothetical protein